MSLWDPKVISVQLASSHPSCLLSHPNESFSVAGGRYQLSYNIPHICFVLAQSPDCCSSTGFLNWCTIDFGDWIFCWGVWRAALFTVGCSAASLASTHEMPVAPTIVETENYLQILPNGPGAFALDGELLP